MRRIFPTIAVIIVLVGIAAFFWNRQTATTTTLAALQGQCEILRSQIATRDQTIENLATSPTEHTTQIYTGAGAEIELARRIADLTVLQSNTLALVERLMARTPEPQMVPPSPQQRQAGIAALETSAQEFQHNFEATKQRAAELLTSLNIPADVSTMEPSKALDTASLKPYWPFFEAKKDRERAERLMVSVQLRIAQEQTESTLLKAKEP